MNDQKARAGALICAIALEEMIPKTPDPEVRASLEHALYCINKAQESLGPLPISPEAMAWAEGEAKRLGLID